MGELFDYAQAMRKITDEQARKAQAALALLRAAGLPKTLEEAAILCGAMTRQQHDDLAEDVELAWKVRPPAPRIARPDPGKDEVMAGSLRRQGRRREVEMAQTRQQMLRASGIEIPLWEILEAEDDKPSTQGEMVDAINMAPPLHKSKYEKKIDTPLWLKAMEVSQEPPAAAPAPPAPPPPKAPPPSGQQSRMPVPAPPPAASPAPAAPKPPTIPAPVPPKPPTVRAQVSAPDPTEHLRQSIKKLNLMIGLAAGGLALVVILILIILAAG